VSELPSSWTRVPFTNVVNVLSTKGHVVDANELSRRGTYPVLTQGDPELDGYTEDASSLYRVDLPLVIFGDHTRALKMAEVPFAVGPNTKVLSATRGINPRFLFYQLPLLLPDSRGYGRHFQFLATSEIALAPFAEQKRIVAAIEEQFSRLDAGVAALERVRQNLKRMRAAVLQAAFEECLSAAPMVPLQTAASTQLGRMLSARRETGKHARHYLRNRDVQWGHIETECLPVMDFADADARRFRLEYGDVIVCEGGEIGRAAVWTHQLDECYYQKALHRVRCSANLDPHYLRYLFEHYATAKFFDRFASGSTIAHLPQEDLRLLPIPLPPIESQRATVLWIQALLSNVERADAEMQALLAKSVSLHSSILASAFSGKLVPQDPTDEPASVLLERIAAQRAASSPPRPTRKPRQLRLPA